MRKPTIAALMLLVLLFASGHARSLIANAQTKVQCGTIIKNEFAQSGQEHRYVISMNAGDKITVSVSPLGDTLLLYLRFFDPAENRLFRMLAPSKNPTYASGVLAARGNYVISLTNGRAGVGVYTLSIGCTQSDGTIIEAGAASNASSSTSAPKATPAPTSPPTSTSSQQAASTPIATFSGVGFPGLAPVDFSKVAKLTLPNGTPITASLSPGFSDIVGFTVTAKAGDVLDLSYTRLSGNLNLGLVVLFPKQQVFFQTSLVTSDRLSTQLTLPAAGQYTIGVFRINLVEPSKPEEISFQILGKLNPK
jgi:hypothetical protein